MKRVIIGITIICFAFLLNLCDTNEPPPPPDGEEPTLELTLEDASCTEAWITLTTTNLQLPAILTLEQYNPVGDTLSQDFILNTQDSILYFDSLLPNKTYTFLASHSGLSGIFSNELSVTTMDTTSHDFTFETFTFGGTAGSSALYDVAIINENNIWVVGDIPIADTSQNGYTLYNAVHWDGINWDLQQIMFYTICGQQSRTAYPASSVFAFSENDIWVGMQGDQIAKLENGIQTQTLCLPWSFTINKIWGSNSNNVYIVGNNGNIVHYNGILWTQIESGTDISLGDIFSNDSNDIFISGANNVNVRGIILKTSGTNSFNTLITSEVISENELFSKLYGSLSSVWVDENNTLYTGGNILFYYKLNRWDYVRSMPENFIGGNPNVYYRGFIHSIRGNSSNDYWVVGDRNTVRHFNGISWKQIGYPYDPGSFRIWRSVSVKDNLCVIVGNNSGAASVMIIRR